MFFFFYSRLALSFNHRFQLMYIYCVDCFLIYLYYLLFHFVPLLGFCFLSFHDFPLITIAFKISLLYSIPTPTPPLLSTVIEILCLFLFQGLLQKFEFGDSSSGIPQYPKLFKMFTYFKIQSTVFSPTKDFLLICFLVFYFLNCLPH